MKLACLAELNRRQPADHPVSVTPHPAVAEVVASGAYRLEPADLEAIAKVERLLGTLPDPPASTPRILDYLNQSSFVRLDVDRREALENAAELLPKCQQLFDRLSNEEQRVCLAVVTALQVPTPL